MQDWYEQRLAELEDRVEELEKLCGFLTVQLQKSEEVMKDYAKQLDQLQNQPSRRERNAPYAELGTLPLSNAVRNMQRQIDSLTDDMEDVITDLDTLFSAFESGGLLDDDDEDDEEDDFDPYDLYDNYDDDDDDDDDDKGDKASSTPPDAEPPAQERRRIRFFRKEN